jgi:hypothetical protein
LVVRVFLAQYSAALNLPSAFRRVTFRRVAPIPARLRSLHRRRRVMSPKTALLHLPLLALDCRVAANAHQPMRNECFCYRATLDDLLADEVMAPVLRSAGYKPDEFREMMTEIALRNSKASEIQICSR